MLLQCADYKYIPETTIAPIVFKKTHPFKKHKTKNYYLCLAVTRMLQAFGLNKDCFLESKELPTPLCLLAKIRKKLRFYTS